MESRNKNIYILKVSLLRLIHILSIQEKESENKARWPAEGGRERFLSDIQERQSQLKTNRQTGPYSPLLSPVLPLFVCIWFRYASVTHT